MVPADEGDEMGGRGGTRRRCGVDRDVDSSAGAGQNLVAETGNRKRKALVMSGDSKILVGNAEVSELGCEVSQRISVEIDKLRSQLDEDVKELGYCEENEKLRIEMDLKDKEMQCLRKQNEDLQAKYDKQDEELQAKYEKQNKKLNEKLLAEFKKQSEELEAMYEKKNQELQSKYEKQNEKLQGNYEKHNKDLKVKYEKKTKELQSKYEEQKEELQAKYEVRAEELQDKYEKKNEELQLKYEGRNEKLQARYEERTEELQAKYEKQNEKLKAKYEKLSLKLEHERRWLEELSGGLIREERESNDELQQAPKEFITTKDDNSELELASIEQHKADEDVHNLLDDQKREKEDALTRQLEKVLHEKQQLELEVTRLNGTLQVMKHLEKLNLELEDEKSLLEELTANLIRKERESNDELQQVRIELMLGLKDELNGQTTIGIKRMGQLDHKPFLNACRRKYGNHDYETKAVELSTKWQEEIKNLNWYPFKMIKQADGEYKEVIDDDDAKLKYLWIEYGDDVCNAVKTALLEVNEYNASGRYAVSELWDYRKGRKATMKEVLKYLFGQMETTTKLRRG